jgi:hypothetical protein
MVPSNFYLSQNYPNPFKDKTTIKYCVPDKTLIKLIVLDSDMKTIKELVNEVKEAGTYKVEFVGAEISSGVYFYQIQAGNFIETKKMILLK